MTLAQQFSNLRNIQEKIKFLDKHLVGVSQAKQIAGWQQVSIIFSDASICGFSGNTEILTATAFYYTCYS